MEKKRFIAAATCPACGAVDTVFTFRQNAQQWRGCAACNMREAFDETPAAAEELPTRVNQPKPGEPVLPHETPVDKVRIIDPRKPG